MKKMKKNDLAPLYLGELGLIYTSSPLEVFRFSGSFPAQILEKPCLRTAPGLTDKNLLGGYGL